MSFFVCLRLPVSPARGSKLWDAGTLRISGLGSHPAIKEKETYGPASSSSFFASLKFVQLRHRCHDFDIFGGAKLRECGEITIACRPTDQKPRLDGLDCQENELLC